MWSAANGNRDKKQHASPIYGRVLVSGTISFTTTFLNDTFLVPPFLPVLAVQTQQLFMFWGFRVLKNASRAQASMNVFLTAFAELDEIFRQ